MFPLIYLIGLSPQLFYISDMHNIVTQLLHSKFGCLIILSAKFYTLLFTLFLSLTLAIGDQPHQRFNEV